MFDLFFKELNGNNPSKTFISINNLKNHTKNTQQKHLIKHTTTQ